MKNLDNDIVFFVSKCFKNIKNHYSTDFFIFKPKLLNNNIFNDKELLTHELKPEIFFYNLLIKNNINTKILPRFDNNHWYPRRIDKLELWHEHDLNNIKTFLLTR